MRKYENSFRDLIVWQKAKDLTLTVYRYTKNFPPEEKYGLTSQLRRSSSSIMANLAEGNERKIKADRVHFFVMAKSSLTEVDCWFELAHELGYLNDEEYERCLEFV